MFAITSQHLQQVAQQRFAASAPPQHSLFNFLLLPNYDNYFLILLFYFLLLALSEPAVTALMFL